MKRAGVGRGFGGFRVLGCRTICICRMRAGKRAGAGRGWRTEVSDAGFGV